MDLPVKVRKGRQQEDCAVVSVILLLSFYVIEPGVRKPSASVMSPGLSDSLFYHQRGSAVEKQKGLCYTETSSVETGGSLDESRGNSLNGKEG